MQNEALQAALALYRAPTERFSLEPAVLPADIGFVLRLASAPQPLLHDTAEELDEAESTVHEAVRFYLQLMLFRPEASAYRVLGLPADSPQRQIREHYRWLQRWLHPDHRGEDWESLYAPRVNWAWNKLRNESARRAYDQEQVPYQGGPAEMPKPEHTPFGPGMRVSTTRLRMSLTQRLSLVALISGCAVLLYAASTRQDSPPADVLAISARPKDVTTSTTQQNIQDNGPTLAQVRRAIEQQRAVAAQLREDEPVGATAPQPSASIAAAEPESRNEPRAMVRRPAPKPARNGVAESQRAEPAHGEHAATTEQSAEAAASETPSQAAAVIAGERAEEPSRGSPAKPVALNVLRADDADALMRAKLAHTRVQELSQFFDAADQRVPPIWNDVQGQSEAERQRSQLRERVRWGGSGDFSVDDSVWRMSSSLASLEAVYRVRVGQDLAESGRLSLKMIWRERMWLVTRVELQPLQ